MTKKQREQATVLVGLAFLAWWLWPKPAEVVTAGINFEGIAEGEGESTDA